jgi:hypothetical protein
MGFKKRVEPFKKEILLDILENSRDSTNGSIDKYRAADALLEVFKFRKSKKTQIIKHIAGKSDKISQE